MQGGRTRSRDPDGGGIDRDTTACACWTVVLPTTSSSPCSISVTSDVREPVTQILDPSPAMRGADAAVAAYATDACNDRAARIHARHGAGVMVSDPDRARVTTAVIGHSSADGPVAIRVTAPGEVDAQERVEDDGAGYPDGAADDGRATAHIRNQSRHAVRRRVDSEQSVPVVDDPDAAGAGTDPAVVRDRDLGHTVRLVEITVHAAARRRERSFACWPRRMQASDLRGFQQCGKTKRRTATIFFW